MPCPYLCRMLDKSGQSLTTAEIIRKIFNRLYSYLQDFGVMLLRLVGFIPFHCFRRFVYRLSGMQVSASSTIHMWANFFSVKNIKIGKDTIIGDHVFLDGRDQITIGDHVDIASQVLIYNSAHDIDSSDFHATLSPVIIEDYVFIGPRVIILPGVTIGKGAVIAAGAVVTKNVAPMTVVGGVPATKIRDRKSNLKYKLGHARLFQ